MLKFPIGDFNSYAFKEHAFKEHRSTHRLYKWMNEEPKNNLASDKKGNTGM
jgi:hypothetical protein